MTRSIAKHIGFTPLILALCACPERALDGARALEASGDLAGAAAAHVEAARRDPANLAAWDGAVRLWCKELHRIDACLEVLDLELDLLGNLQRHRDVLSEALEARARARLEQGLAKSALMDLERARKAGPSRASVMVATARAYVALGAREAAVQSLEKARQLDPNNAEADQVARMIPAAAGFGGEGR